MFYSIQHETTFRKYPEKTHLSLVMNGQKERTPPTRVIPYWRAVCHLSDSEIHVVTE